VWRLAEDFQARFGRSPDGVWAAPGRVNLIGEHTDYNDGFVLPFALDRTTHAAVAVREDGRARVASTAEGEAPEMAVADIAPGRVEGWSAYVLGVLWALREAGVDVPGVDVLLDSNVPSGGGLSSSAALECSVALAVSDLTGARLDRAELAAACRRAENDVVGAPTGVMDQMAVLLGRARHALFLDCRSLAAEQVPFDGSVVIVDTGGVHALADAEGGYADRRRACDEAARALGVKALRDATLDAVETRLDGDLRRRARHVVTENARVLEVVELLRVGNLAGAGDRLTSSHASMRDDFEISTPALDAAVDTALEAGALGARMTGGGFGGSAIALVTPDVIDAVSSALEPHGSVSCVSAVDAAHRVV
jgi:galactokinase